MVNEPLPNRLIARYVPHDDYILLRDGAIVEYQGRKARMSLKTVEHVSEGEEERHAELNFTIPYLGEATHEFDEVLMKIDFRRASDSELL